MNWTVFAATLAKLGAPVDDAQIATALAHAADSDDEREEVDEYEQAPREWLRENDHEAPLSTALSFSWTGMYASTLSVALLDGGETGLLVLRDDTVPERDWIVLGTLTSPRSPFAVIRAVRRLDAVALLGEAKPDRIAVFPPLPVRAALAWCGASATEMACT
jgi:hypothetical protein